MSGLRRGSYLGKADAKAGNHYQGQIALIDNVLLVGAGKWGQKYVSTLAEFPNVSLMIASRNNWKALIDQKPDAVIVCTPPQSHIEIASYALNKNIPTMIEKPLALSLEDAESISQYDTVPVLVNHIHLFASIYQDIRHQLLGKRIKSIRTVASSNSAERDYSRLWDYGPHDIAMVLDLSQQYPHTVECISRAPRQFDITMKFDDFDALIEIGVSDQRQRLLNINDGEFVYDGMREPHPPLKEAIKVFLDATHGSKDYRLGLDLPLKTMCILERCQASLKTSQGS
jgi:predicted dehydrogenase